MQLPFFYLPAYKQVELKIQLDEDTSRHIISVLRKTIGEKILLTDGKGNKITAEIIDDHKKNCVVHIVSKEFQKQSERKISIAISLLKNANRFEWFLEKATEIAVTEIIPLVCERTETQKFRSDRLQQICVSAMLQSQQCWLPILHEPVKYIEYIKNMQEKKDLQKFIAFCEESNARNNLSTYKPFNLSTILIGPEGDFTAGEIELALEQKFIPVSLGETRLRTETAGVVAATLLNRI